MRETKIKIRGSDWRAYLVTAAEFDKHIGKTDAAVTYTNERKIVFRADCINLITVRHEMFHAFMSESHLTSCELKVWQFEEAACEVYANCVADMNKASNMIYRWLRSKA